MLRISTPPAAHIRSGRCAYTHRLVRVSPPVANSRPAPCAHPVSGMLAPCPISQHDRAALFSIFLIIVWQCHAICISLWSQNKATSFYHATRRHSPRSDETIANIAITLIHQCDRLLPYLQIPPKTTNNPPSYSDLFCTFADE